MLTNLIDDIRAWHRRVRTERELSHLDPHLRADIGLPPFGKPVRTSRKLFNERHGRS
ncbi:MAG: DUF1127 domain-containing protein [Rhodospirillales bacterium]|nr:DUF1127 domain-containing protein [Rhodospirillales bacterium]